MSFNPPIVVGLLCAFANAAAAQPQVGMSLDPGSFVVLERCLPPCACAELEFRGPAAGGYSRTLQSENREFRVFAIEGVRLNALLNGFREVEILANGTYRLGRAETGAQHELVLEAVIDGNPWRFESGLVPADGRPFPAIDISAESAIRGCSRYTISLNSTPSCRADFNEDGFVDFFDLDDFVDAFERGRRAADFNLDGFIDYFDFDDYVRAFERGC
jgi:hypothetical protein